MHERFLLMETAPIWIETFVGDKIWHGEPDIAEYFCNNPDDRGPNYDCSRMVDTMSNGEANLGTHFSSYGHFQDPPLPMDQVTVTFKVE